MLLLAIGIGNTDATAQLCQQILAAGSLQPRNDVVGHEPFAIGEHAVDVPALRDMDEEVRMIGHDGIAHEAVALVRCDVHPLVHGIIGVGFFEQGQPAPASEGAEVHRQVFRAFPTDGHMTKLEKDMRSGRPRWQDRRVPRRRPSGG